MISDTKQLKSTNHILQFLFELRRQWWKRLLHAQKKDLETRRLFAFIIFTWIIDAFMDPFDARVLKNNNKSNNINKQNGELPTFYSTSFPIEEQDGQI